MSDAPRTRIEPEASYPCCNCCEEYSWNAEDLRWFNNELWCANCFDELDAAGDRLLWRDLDRFVPKLERENAELRNLLRIADDLIDEYAEVVEHCDNVDEMREQIKAALAAERAGK